ncbi:MAG: site-specific integrase [Tenericutes bacterium]|nr:site-specific integrase [Mycoplasmatota bacterium]
MKKKRKAALKDLIRDYQEYSKMEKAIETVRYQESHARGWIKFFDTYNIIYTRELNEATLTKFRIFARKTCKPITENKRILYLKQVFKYHNIDNEALFSLKKIRETKLSYNIIHENDLKKIIDYTLSMDESNPYYLTRKIIILLLLDTGVRQSELLNIEIFNIDFNESSIYLTRTKTRLARTVFFTKLTKSLIMKYIDLGPQRKYLLWNYIGHQPFTYRNLEWVMKKIKVDLGLKMLNARMFRHTMATALAENGCDIYIIQKILGHTDISTTEIYLHMSLKKAKSDYSKFNLIDNIDKQLN